MRPVTIALFVSILMAAGLSAVHAEEPPDCEPPLPLRRHLMSAPYRATRAALVDGTITWAK